MAHRADLGSIPVAKILYEEEGLRRHSSKRGYNSSKKHSESTWILGVTSRFMAYQ